MADEASLSGNLLTTWEDEKRTGAAVSYFQDGRICHYEDHVCDTDIEQIIKVPRRPIYPTALFRPPYFSKSFNRLFISFYAGVGMDLASA